MIDFKALGVDYPNYGASLEEYPVDTGRLRHVIELVAEKSGWGKEKSGNGVGYGFAAHRSFLTYVACVVKVQVNGDGEITIPRVDYVVDAGTVVNPDRTKSQFEGAAVFGTSIARYGEITAKNGAIEQSNFNDYPVARINEAPYHTNVYLVENDAPPAGSGRARRSAVCAGIVQCDFCGHRSADPRTSAVETRLQEDRVTGKTEVDSNYADFPLPIGTLLTPALFRGIESGTIRGR